MEMGACCSSVTNDDDLSTLDCHYPQNPRQSAQFGSRTPENTPHWNAKEQCESNWEDSTNLMSHASSFEKRIGFDQESSISSRNTLGLCQISPEPDRRGSRPLSVLELEGVCSANGYYYTTPGYFCTKTENYDDSAATATDHGFGNKYRGAPAMLMPTSQTSHKLSVPISSCQVQPKLSASESFRRGSAPQVGPSTASDGPSGSAQHSPSPPIAFNKLPDFPGYGAICNPNLSHNDSQYCEHSMSLKSNQITVQPYLESVSPESTMPNQALALLMPEMSPNLAPRQRSRSFCLQGPMLVQKKITNPQGSHVQLNTVGQGSGSTRRRSLVHQDLVTTMEELIRKAKQDSKTITVMEGNLFIDYEFIGPVPKGLRIKI